MAKYIIIFDLDDTLYKEIDFLKSAYHDIADYLSIKAKKPAKQILKRMLLFYNNGVNVFEEILKEYKINLKTDALLHIYRHHNPNIKLTPQTKKILTKIRLNAYKVGLITDGRSIQQRNKIEALGLSDYFDDIIISEEFGTEKPHKNNYNFFVEKYGNSHTYVYIGDNINKDFITPNSLFWISICLKDNGENIHKQSTELEKNAIPQHFINDFMELEAVLPEVMVN